jgi:hypothetical protein
MSQMTERYAHVAPTILRPWVLMLRQARRQGGTEHGGAHDLPNL